MAFLSQSGPHTSKESVLWFYWLVLLLTLATPCQATVSPADKRVVTIGVVADNEPYSFFEGRNPSGFSIDVLREVARNANLAFDFRAGSWPDIYAAFMRGDLDAIDGISWRPERAENILFTDPYHFREVYLMRDSARYLPPIQQLEDLEGLKVGVVENIFYLNSLQHEDLDIHTYDTLPSLVRALAFGWVDVAMGPRLTLEYLANRAGFRFLETVTPAPLEHLSREDFRIGVRSGNQALLQRLQAGLDAIPDERLNNLRQRWQEFGGVSAEQGARLPLTSEQLQFLAALGPVRVGFMDDYAPFSFTDGGRTLGLSVDIMNRLADLTGLQIIPVRGQWDELIPMLQSGDIDIMANMSYRPERETFARFTQPYHTIPNVIFTREESLDYSELRDLQGYKLAIGAGIYYEDAVRSILGPDNLFTFSTQEPMFQALAKGDVDVVINALHSGNYWIHELGISGVRIAGELMLPGFTGEDLRFGVRPSLSPLADILNQALATISPTEQRTIETRWLGATARSASNPESRQITWNAEQTEWLKQRNHIVRICVDPDWSPLEAIENGKHVGLSAQTLALFEARTDIRFVLIPTASWRKSIEAARKRRCDMFPLAMETPERSRYMDFTTPYLEVPNVVMGRIEAPFIERLGDLSERPVGVVDGYAFAELLQQRYPAMQLVPVSSEEDGLRQLQNGTLAGYITTLATASYYMQSLGLADLKVIGRVPADWSLAIATRNDEPILNGIMQRLVSSLTPEERDNLESNWRNLRIEERVDYSRFWQTLIVGLLITALLFYWNRKLGRLNRELAEANEALSRLSVTDNLTQLGNRSYFDREFPRSFQWCQRHKTGFAVAMVDADHFKKINDTWGHEAGDQCLQALADVMREHFRRETDRLSRFGGEEFIIFTSYEDASDIMDRLERFRTAVANRQCDTCQGSPIELTVSIGLAYGVPEPTGSPAEYLRQADQALYAAKGNGRNRLEARQTGRKT